MSLVIPDTGKHKPVVYRILGARRVLLYVGCTENLGKRLLWHRDNQKWWPDAQSFWSEEFSTREEARQAEDEAIWAEIPMHNRTTGVPDKVTVLTMRTAYALGARIQEITFSVQGRRRRRLNPQTVYRLLEGVVPPEWVRKTGGVLNYAEQCKREADGRQDEMIKILTERAA